MNDFFVLIFLLAAMAFVFSLIRMGLNHRRETLTGGEGARSLGTAELRTLLAEAVAEGVAPLEQRVERMERSLRRLERRAPAELPPRGAQALLDDASHLADAGASAAEDRRA